MRRHGVSTHSHNGTVTQGRGAFPFGAVLSIVLHGRDSATGLNPMDLGFPKGPVNGNSFYCDVVSGRDGLPFYGPTGSICF